MKKIALSLLILDLIIVACDASPTTASWYGSKGDKTIGKKMANGKKFDPEKMTCASWFYPFGTRLSVSRNAKTIIVTVTDRGPHKRLVKEGRKIDLSRAAFRQLAPLKKGLICVTIKKLK